MPHLLVCKTITRNYGLLCVIATNVNLRKVNIQMRECVCV